ncbi:hypothetical protein, partial [Caballeronia sp. INSB1]|uniref:hypothetical protein n=1 Tax=Caballeronia sp. INSB1 TaxID=2921751 RepID=UPI00203279F0
AAVTFFAAAKKVTAAPHRGNANKPIRKRDPAKNETQKQSTVQTHKKQTHYHRKAPTSALALKNKCQKPSGFF